MRFTVDTGTISPPYSTSSMGSQAAVSFPQYCKASIHDISSSDALFGEPVIFTRANGKSIVSYTYSHDNSYNKGSLRVDVPTEFLMEPGKIVVEHVGEPTSRRIFTVVAREKPDLFKFPTEEEEIARRHAPEEATPEKVEEIERTIHTNHNNFSSWRSNFESRLTQLESNSGSGGGSGSGVVCMFMVQDSIAMPMMSDESEFGDHLEEILYGVIPVSLLDSETGGVYRCHVVNMDTETGIPNKFYFLTTNGAPFYVENTGTGEFQIVYPK